MLSLQVISRGSLSTIEAHIALRGLQRPDDRHAAWLPAHVHLARGALRLAEVYGGAFLAEEMEFVAPLVDAHFGEGGRGSDGLDALMRAMKQLPSYIDHVHAGAHDLPATCSSAC